MKHIVDKLMLTGKTAMVTGGHSGIGRGISEALSQAGANLAIVGRREKLGLQVADEIAKTNQVKAMFIPMDITSGDDIQNAVNKTVEAFGGIDILVNCAGTVRHEAAEAITRESWRHVMDVNLEGLFFMSQAVGQVMIQQKKGNIINISSNSDQLVMTPQKQVSYNASKAGVDMVTKCLAYEWAKHNIRVNAVAPGYVATELLPETKDENGRLWKDIWQGMIPAGRMGTPEEIGAMVLYIASDMSPFLTGSVLLMDGGYSLT